MVHQTFTPGPCSTDRGLQTTGYALPTALYELQTKAFGLRAKVRLQMALSLKSLTGRYPFRPIPTLSAPFE